MWSLSRKARAVAALIPSMPSASRASAIGICNCSRAAVRRSIFPSATAIRRPASINCALRKHLGAHYQVADASSSAQLIDAGRRIAVAEGKVDRLTAALHRLLPPPLTGHVDFHHAQQPRPQPSARAIRFFQGRAGEQVLEESLGVPPAEFTIALLLTESNAVTLPVALSFGRSPGEDSYVALLVLVSALPGLVLALLIRRSLQAGVMIRNGVNPGSPSVWLQGTAAGLNEFVSRDAAGVVSRKSADAPGGFTWHRLVRNGTAISAWESGNGVDWRLIGVLIG